MEDRFSPASLRAAVDTIDLAAFIQILWRRKWVIAACGILAGLLTFIITSQMTPLFAAEAKLLLDTRERNFVDIDSVVGTSATDSAQVRSEIEVLRSRNLIRQVIERNDLLRNPELNRSLTPRVTFIDMLDPVLPASTVQWLKGASAAEPANIDPLRRREAIMVSTINTILGKLSIEPVRGSRVIRIKFVSESPETAQEVANAVAETYLEQQLEARFDATRRATRWLSERLDTLRDKVEASENAVEAFRARTGIVEGRDGTLDEQELTEISSRLIDARARRAAAEARLREVQNLLDDPDNLAAFAEVLNAPTIIRMRDEEATLARREAELSTRYGPKHPRMINLRAELADARRGLEAETDKIIASIRNDVSIARSEERSLLEQRRALEARSAEVNAASVQLRTLEREAEANRALFETFLGRFKETSQQQELESADARIIASAVRPGMAFFPQPKKFSAVAMMAGLMIGVLAALLLEYFDRGFRSMEQIETRLGVSALGLIPELASLGRNASGTTPQNYILQKPVSAFGEAVRTVRTALLLSDVDRPPRTVLVTSSSPREGKTAFCVSLARLASLSGQRIILIDCDLRRPRVHKDLDIENSKGVVELLMGTSELADVTRSDDPSGIHVITAGQSVPNPADLLASGHMRQLLDTLSSRYDLVIIDSPPVMAVADPRVLSVLADKTIFLVRWAETRREVATHALRQLLDAGANLAGVLLTRVNIRRHAAYGYSDSGYYQGSYRKYYQE